MAAMTTVARELTSVVDRASCSASPAYVLAGSLATSPDHRASRIGGLVKDRRATGGRGVQGGVLCPLVAACRNRMRNLALAQSAPTGSFHKMPSLRV
jgi:hypothetical protein